LIYLSDVLNPVSESITLGDFVTSPIYYINKGAESPDPEISEV